MDSTVVISNMNIIGSFHYVTKHLAQCLMCAVYVVIESLMIYYMTPRGNMITPAMKLVYSYNGACVVNVCSCDHVI